MNLSLYKKGLFLSSEILNFSLNFEAD